MFYVYLLQSQKDKTYYIGQTKNKEARLSRHNLGQVLSTKSRIPWIMVGYEEYPTREQSRWREYVLKNDYTKKKKFIKKLTGSPNSARVA